MKNKTQREPLATFMALSTLIILGASSRHCMKKYSGGGSSKRRIGIKFIKKPWRLF